MLESSTLAGETAVNARIETEMIEALVVHHIAGRMRVRVPAAKRDAELLQKIRSSVQEVPGVIDVSANAALGTLIIQYDSALLGEMIQRVKEHASKAGLFLLRPADNEDARAPVSQVNRAVDRYFGKVNRIIEGATGGAVNLKRAISVRHPSLFGAARR